MKKLPVLIFAFILIISSFGTGSSVQAAGFTDVPARALKEVNYLAEGKIVSGFTATKFVPSKTITRAEAAVFIGRTLQVDGTQRKTRFIDLGAGNFASGYVESLTEKGIILGGPDGKFAPSKIVTRGEMAVLLARAFGYKSNAEQALMNLGIASGLENGTFGSNLSITRADFAVFLARAINPSFRLTKKADFTAELTSTANNLNIRSGPSTAFASIGKISANTKLSGAHSIGGWTYVKTGSTTGFISASYLRKAQYTEEVSPVTESGGLSLSNQTIILDPGHGGKDPGAVAHGLKEKDIALKTSLQVNNLLKRASFNVKMTRSTDVFLELKDRAAFAKNNNGDIFVSIHANAATAAANGTETYYYAAGNPHVEDSKLLAAKIQKRMLEAWGLRDRGVKSGNFSVLRENTMPAALLELGFVTNAGDAAKLGSDEQLNKMSIAIYNGILDYYKAKGYNVHTLYK